MAAAQDHSRLAAALPPSPPPSPPRRRHKKKHADPFSELGASPLPSPSPPSSPKGEPEEPQESVITRIILTPLLFTSFLISLFLINRSHRARRASEHRTPTLLSYFWPSTWIDPEPYQDPSDTTWERDGAPTHYEPHAAISPRSSSNGAGDPSAKKRPSWHLHKKIRKVAKLEISDALEMRGRVLVGLVVALVLCAVGVWWAVRWMAGWVWWGGVARAR